MSCSSPFATQQECQSFDFSAWIKYRKKQCSDLLCNSSSSSNQMFLFCYCCCCCRCRCHCCCNRVWTCSWMSIKLHKGTHRRHKHHSDSCDDSYFPSWKIDYNKSFAKQEWWCFLANMYRRLVLALLCFTCHSEQGMYCVYPHINSLAHWQTRACSLSCSGTYTIIFCVCPIDW